MSSSSNSSRVRVNMEYEPSVYCTCGLKAPICTSRESGKQFFGCQRWKDGNGCGFFRWKDDSARRGEGDHEQLKNLVVSMRGELEGLRELMQGRIVVVIVLVLMKICQQFPVKP
ncbi:PREDICTED: uncharacterized protein LOC109180723 [Ipomoea nil]|uniref:uncharacterized protein LOC109180723 n=1 Tax=Ipomoea nil TaxID=35883 RepID=UPI000901892E|nr:PREDICTED: uncharacterized protein LOC109180723 [Ipomoea nil]